MLALAGVTYHAGNADAAQDDRPNIVLIIADDLGWGDVGFHGGVARTPNLDAMARRGIELDRFYVNPLCSPTRAALFTGRSPIEVGVTRPVGAEQPGLPLDEHLMPESFGAAGYQTALAGVTPANDKPFGGINLWPHLRDDRPAPTRDHRVLAQRGASVTDGRWKLVTLKRGRRTTSALYDLRSDPNETRDLADEHPAVVSRLAKLMP